jgi:hypothetical protein
MAYLQRIASAKLDNQQWFYLQLLTSGKPSRRFRCPTLDTNPCSISVTALRGSFSSFIAGKANQT